MRYMKYIMNKMMVAIIILMLCISVVSCRTTYNEDSTISLQKTYNYKFITLHEHFRNTTILVRAGDIRAIRDTKRVSEVYLWDGKICVKETAKQILDMIENARVDSLN